MSKIPPRIADRLEPEFIAALRDSYIQQEPTAQRLNIAIDLANDLGRSYLDGALARSREAFRKILVAKLDTRPDEEDPTPDHRGPAALLFLYGRSAGYWTATPDETELSRAHVITTYGMGALEMLKLEKTKDDLASEAGLPTKCFAYERPRDSRTAKRIIDDYLYVQGLAEKAELIAARTPIDLDALGAALKSYLEALQRYFPASYEMQTAHLRRTLAPVVAKSYVELLKCHEQSQR